LKWNWDSPSWKKSNKILLLLATIWPVIYMVLFFAIVFSMISLTSLAGSPGHRNCGYLDALQLYKRLKHYGKPVEMVIYPKEDHVKHQRTTGRHHVAS